MSANRGEFVSRLFSRPLMSAQFDPQASVEGVFDALAGGRGDVQLFTQNLQAIKDRLQKNHAFPLTASDFKTIEYIYNAFYRGGPEASLTTYGTSYRLLMRQTDTRGRNW